MATYSLPSTEKKSTGPLIEERESREECSDRERERACI